MVVMVHLDECGLPRIVCPFEEVDGISDNVHGWANRAAKEASARTANIGSVT